MNRDQVARIIRRMEVYGNVSKCSEEYDNFDYAMVFYDVKDVRFCVYAYFNVSNTGEWQMELDISFNKVEETLTENKFVSVIKFPVTPVKDVALMQLGKAFDYIDFYEKLAKVL